MSDEKLIAFMKASFQQYRENASASTYNDKDVYKIIEEEERNKIYQKKDCKFGTSILHLHDFHLLSILYFMDTIVDL
jgi:hypothetical protein